MLRLFNNVFDAVKIISLPVALRLPNECTPWSAPGGAFDVQNI